MLHQLSNKTIDISIILCYNDNIIIQKTKNIKIKNDYRKETFCLKLFE